MNTLRNVVLWAMMVMGVVGCREASSVAPDSEDGEIHIDAITMDVSLGGTLQVTGKNIGKLVNGGEIVCYDRQDIHVSIRAVFQDGRIVWPIPDSLCSGRIRIVEEHGRVVIDTVLYVYGTPHSRTGTMLVQWNQYFQGADATWKLRSSDGKMIDLIPITGGALMQRLTGDYQRVDYDSVTRLYHATSQTVRIQEPALHVMNHGFEAMAWIENLPGPIFGDWRVRFRSSSMVVERAVIAANMFDVPRVSLKGIPFGSYMIDIVTGSLEGSLSAPFAFDESEDVPSIARVELKFSVPVQLLRREGHYPPIGPETREFLETNRNYVDTMLEVDYAFIHSIEHHSADSFELFPHGSVEPGDLFDRVASEGAIVLRKNSLSCVLTITGTPRPRYGHLQYVISLSERPYIIDDRGRIVVEIRASDLVATHEIAYRYVQRSEKSADYGLVETMVECTDPHQVVMTLVVTK